jgi:UDP-2,3-diacylglucosamine pyrophosphatase LpxH
MLSNIFRRALDSPPRRFEFAFQHRPYDGRRVLYFPYMSRSDIHWGTQYCRAKKLCHMEENTWAAENDYPGDIYDGTHARDKFTWNLGPWHRQGMAHALRKADQGGNVKVFQGNHEYGINKTTGENKKPYRHISGKNIYGIDFVIEASHRDEKNRSILRLHGDKYDDQLFKSEKSKGFWYKFGDVAYTGLYEVDRGIRLIPPLEHFSVAALGKKAVKSIINGLMGINDVIAQALDESPYDVMIYGHSHMPGFVRTPSGKLLINDGCCTEHVNALVRDANGTYAILTWHSDGIEVEEEPPPGHKEGAKYRVSFKEHGFSEALEPAVATEDEYTARADKIIRLLYHTWPAKDVQKIIKQRKIERAGKPRDHAASTPLPVVPIRKPPKEALNPEHILA